MVTASDLAALLGISPDGEATALQAAIDAVRVVDAEGRAPIDDGYVPTSDLYLAAAVYLELLAARMMLQPAGLESVTSEGTTMKFRDRAPGDLFALARWYRSQSPLSRMSTQVAVVELDNDGDWFPRSNFSRRMQGWR